MLHYRVTLRIIQAFFCYMLIASSCVSAVQAQVAKAPEQKKDTSTPGNAPSGTPGSPSDQGTTPPAPATAPMPIVPANQGAKTPAEVITSAKAAIQFAQNNIDKANMLVKLLNPNIDAKPNWRSLTSRKLFCWKRIMRRSGTRRPLPTVLIRFSVSSSMAMRTAKSSSYADCHRMSLL